MLVVVKVVDPIVLEGTLATSLTKIVHEAGEIALGFFRQGAACTAEVFTKTGGSPVTEADFQVDRFLKEKLEALVPEAAWLSEETIDTDARLSNNLVLIVDPIDGTRAFAHGEIAWCIAVGIAEQGRPIFGLIYAPVLKQTYIAAKGQGAFLNGHRLSVSDCTTLDAKTRVSGPPGMAEELRQLGVQFDLQPRVPSLALRIARVASGELDAAFASENAHDWDIAAADLILHEAGGVLGSFQDGPLIYNRPDTQHGLLTATPVRLQSQLISAFRTAKAAKPQKATH
jgi:myo-inositol-1(or 4)-monophosphatase